MINRLQRLPQGPRVVIFVFMVVGTLLLLGGATLFLLTLTLNSTPRQNSQALVAGVTVAQFAALPGEDAYPSTVAVGPDGTVYTASYATGTIWRISADGSIVSEINTVFESVTALAARADGSLLAVAFTGGDDGEWAVFTAQQSGDVAEFAKINDERGFVSPFDIAIDTDGGVYVLDRSRAEIWRWDGDGANPELWWSLVTPPVNSAESATPSPLVPPAPTGLAFDPVADALLVTDLDANTVVRIPRDRSASEVIFRSDDVQFPPGLDGIAVAPDGTIYVTALDQKGVARVDSNLSLTYIAGNFRGPSDLVFTPSGALLVANFDSAALVQPGIRPQLPFALDLVTFE